MLLVDETSIRRRHRYVTVVACGDSGKVLAMIPGRTKASLARFFREQGAWWCRQVETVVSDGSRPNQAAINQYLPDARHVLDRFHVVRWSTQGLTLVRREIQRRDPDRRPPTFEPDLFRARFTLLGRADHLTEAPQAHLDRLFDAHPRLHTDSDVLQELYQLYEADDWDQANAALGRFGRSTRPLMRAAVSVVTSSQGDTNNRSRGQECVYLSLRQSTLVPDTAERDAEPRVGGQRVRNGLVEVSQGFFVLDTAFENNHQGRTVTRTGRMLVPRVENVFGHFPDGETTPTPPAQVAKPRLRLGSETLVQISRRPWSTSTVRREPLPH